jgi:hypothetical protein
MPRAGWSKGASGNEILEQMGILAARRAAVLRAGVIFQGVWKEVLNQPGGGKRYEQGVAFITTKGSPRRVVPVKGTPGHPGRARAHTASRRGEAPAKDRGVLAASVLVGQESDGRVRVGMGGPRGRIGLALEYGVNTAGTRVGPHPATGFKIDPRPHARPARDEAARQMTKGIVTVLKTKTKGPAITGGR